MLGQREEKLVRELFKEYYNHIDINDIAPSAVEKREFGFGDFEKKISYRHFAFKSPSDLKKYILENIPVFINASGAEYERPGARPMEAKGWLGSELLFDLDATDLHLKCQDAHGRSWVCDECLGAVKEETVRLVEDFLKPDFGFSDKEIAINFSGNRGYHIHVNNENIFRLDSRARRNISEYISGMGITAQSFFPTLGQRGEALLGPKPADYGWGGKFARGFIAALNSGEGALTALGVEKRLAHRLLKNKADIVLGITLGNWDKVRIPKKAEFWSTVISNMAIKQSDSIDKNVTNGTNHLIRLAGSLHGDTGLVGRKISSLMELEAFEPMRDSVVFKGKNVSVNVAKAPAFKMNDESFGPYENIDVELPIYAALYLILKRVASLK